MIECDFRKTAIEALRQKPPSVLVLDFIDERFDLLDIDGSLVNGSQELYKTGFVRDEVGCRIIPRLSEEAFDLWKHGLQELAALLSEPMFKETRVVLHSARWATTYVKGGETYRFPDEILLIHNAGIDIRASIDNHNKLLQKFDEEFCVAIPKTQVISISQELNVADAEHMWGLSPFHFVRGYYSEFLDHCEALSINFSIPPEV